MKAQRYKAVIKNGRPAGAVRQTNAKTPAHKLVDALKPKKGEKKR